MKYPFIQSILALAIAISVLFTGCGASATADRPEARPESPGSSNSSYEQKAEDTEVPVSEEGIFNNESSSSNPNSLENKNIKLIWRANVSAETLDFDKMIEGMNASVKEFGGFVESSSLEGGEYLDGYSRPRYGYYVIRIPAEKMDAFLDQIGTIGNVTRSSKSSENITLNYADTEARKETLLLEQKKIMELLEQATELSDIIQLEARLSEIHYQLDEYSSTLRRYDNLVDFCTIELNIQEVEHVTSTPVTLGERITSGFSDSLYELSEFGEDLIVFLIARSPIILVWVLVIGLLIFLICKFRNRPGKKSKEKKPKNKMKTPEYNSTQSFNNEKSAEPEDKKE